MTQTDFGIATDYNFDGEAWGGAGGGFPSEAENTSSGGGGNSRRKKRKYKAGSTQFLNLVSTGSGRNNSIAGCYQIDRM